MALFYNDTQRLYQIGDTWTASANSVPRQPVPSGTPLAISLTGFSQTPGPFVNSPDQFTLRATEAAAYDMYMQVSVLGDEISTGATIELWMEYNSSGVPSYQFGSAFLPATGKIITIPFTGVTKFVGGDTVRLFINHTSTSPLHILGLPNVPSPGLATHITFTRITT